MTWAEFCIRQHAYRRMDKDQWMKVREIAYSALVGSHLDPKKLPKTKNDFIKLDEKQEKVTDLMKEAINNARNAFFKNSK
jgi:hypothetical protein